MFTAHQRFVPRVDRPRNAVLQTQAPDDYKAAGGLPAAVRGALAHTSYLSNPADLTPHSQKRSVMLHYAVVFFVIALIAALFGFTGLAAGAAGIAQAGVAGAPGTGLTVTLVGADTQPVAVSRTVTA